MYRCINNYLNHRSLKAADDIREQLRLILSKQKLPVNNTKPSVENIKKCLMAGFFMQVAHLQQNDTYMTIKDSQVVAIHPSSVLDHRPEFVLYHDFVLTKRNFIRTCLGFYSNLILLFISIKILAEMYAFYFSRC